MLASLSALALGSAAFAQQAPESDHDYAKFYLDPRGTVVAIDLCDREQCWALDLTEHEVSYDPATGGFDVADKVKVSSYWNCWESEEELMSICVWKEDTYRPGGDGPCGSDYGCV